MQLVDELSMIYTTCLMMHASFAYSRSRTFSAVLGIGLLSLSGSITVSASYLVHECRGIGDPCFRTKRLREAQVYYHVTKDPVFHQVAYAFLTATVVFRSMWVMESQLRPVLSARDPEEAARVLNTMWAMIATGSSQSVVCTSWQSIADPFEKGLSVFLGGFLIWNLDNVFCSQVRQLRHAVGLPWAVLLEGHAWWHLMTGLGNLNTPIIAL
jgi:dihydroceramidase